MNAMRRGGLRGIGEGTLRSRCLGLPNGETTTRKGGSLADAVGSLRHGHLWSGLYRDARLLRNDGGSWRAGRGVWTPGLRTGLNRCAEMEGFLAALAGSAPSRTRLRLTHASEGSQSPNRHGPSRAAGVPSVPVPDWGCSEGASPSPSPLQTDQGARFGGGTGSRNRLTSARYRYGDLARSLERGLAVVPEDRGRGARRLTSVGPERGDRMDAAGAAGRQVGGEGGRGAEDERHADERQRVERADLEQ